MSTPRDMVISNIRIFDMLHSVSMMLTEYLEKKKQFDDRIAEILDQQAQINKQQSEINEILVKGLIQYDQGPIINKGVEHGKGTN